MTNIASPPSAAAGYEVIQPPTNLKSRVRPGSGPDFDAIERAEKALEKLSKEFSSWIVTEIDALNDIRARLHEYGIAGEPRAMLYRSAHDLRGQGATLGFPLVSRVAESLCNLLDRVPEPEAPPIDLVDKHVDAARAIVHENAGGSGTTLARNLVAALCDVTDEYVVGRLRQQMAARGVATS